MSHHLTALQRKKFMKTPIKPRHTFHCAEALGQIIPKDRKIKSFLLHSGQLEFDLSLSGHDLLVATNKFVIYEFWDCLLKNPYLIAEMANNLHEKLDAQLVYVFQNDWPKFKDPFFRSALFFILNKYSLTGSISHGSFNSNNYSALSGRSLLNFCETHDLSKINLKYYNTENWLDWRVFSRMTT